MSQQRCLIHPSLEVKLKFIFIIYFYFREVSAMRSLRTLPILLLLLVSYAFGGSREPAETSAPVITDNAAAAPVAFAGPIQDNSFLVEEAYNQEDGVVQHISFFERLATANGPTRKPTNGRCVA